MNDRGKSYMVEMTESTYENYQKWLQETADDPRRSEHFYMIWNLESGRPTKKHTNKYEAFQEAQRLCNSGYHRQGDIWYVLEVLGSYIQTDGLNPPRWTKADK